MCAMPVPLQITSLGETAHEPPIKPASPQWYEEKPTTEAGKVEEADQHLKDKSPLTNAVPQKTTNTLIPDEALAEVVNTTKVPSKQAITTISEEDPITSLADITENKAIQEINSAHGTK